MPPLNDLRTTLQTRFNNEPVFYALDLGQPGEQDFFTILGVGQLTFISPQISDIQEGKLTITGKTTVFGLESLDFNLIIEENENGEYGKYLAFTLKPQSSLPDTWEFSQSFPNIKASFFDNLVLSDSYLIATSFEHAITSPDISLSKGINFTATTKPEKALKSLNSLCPSVSAIALQGIINREGDRYGVNLNASVTDAPITIPSPLSLHLKHIPAKENEQNIANFEGNLTISKVNFPYSIAIPTSINPLDGLEVVLKERIHNGNLEFWDTDLGTDVADDFFTYVGTHKLEITEASVERQDNRLIVSGKTSVFHLDNNRVHIIVMENNSALTYHIEEIINLGNFSITLNADESVPKAEWVLEGHLAQKKELEFDSLFNNILPSGLPLPYDDYFFPRIINITSADISLIPKTGKFHLEAVSTSNWEFKFACVTFSIKNIKTTLDLESANNEENRLYTFAAGGNITLCDLSADLLFETSNKATEDTALTAEVSKKTTGNTILTAEIKPEQARNISLKEIFNTLTTDEQTGDKWETIVPDDFESLSFKQGYIHLNLTENQFFLYGNVEGFGSIVSLTKKYVNETKESTDVTEKPADITENPEDESWGYLFALDLGPDFTFKKLFSDLSVVDNIVKVKNAGIFLSSFKESSNDLIKAVKLVANNPEKLEGFTLPLPKENLPEKSLEKGIYFYADLDFSATSLFSTILKIGNIETGHANVIISAFIAKENSTNTTFMADLPDITIFNTIIFTHTNDYPGIHLEYTAKDGKQNEYQLIGRTNISLFNCKYSFDGSVIVNTEKIDSRLQLASDSETIQIPMPFGIPGIVFKDLYMGVRYTFAEETTLTTRSFLIGGSVSFGEALSFSGQLQLKESTPVLAMIQLDKELSIGKLIAQSFNAKWPENFIDITFLKDSLIYYYDKSSDPDSQFGISRENHYLYKDGFNIKAKIILKILNDISFELTARVVQEPDKTYKGIIIDAGLPDTIDLFVLQIASTSKDTTGKYIAGPSLVVNTVDDTQSFGLEAGFNFFQEPFGTAGVNIRKGDVSDEMELAGHMESAESIDPFGKLSLDFTYSKSKGFQIQNWPEFDLDSVVIDFIKEIEALCDDGDGTPCGKFSELLTDVAFQTKFTISPSFKTNEYGLHFVLTGHYSLTILSTDDPFVTVTFPPCEFLLPNNLSLSALPGEIVNSIQKASTEFVKALINDPKHISKFLSILFGKEATKIALEMACRELIDGLTVETTDAAVGAFASAEAAALAEGAAPAAAAAAGVAAAISIVEIIDKSSSCFITGTKVLLFDGTIKSIETIMIGDTLLGQDYVPNKVLKYDHPLLGNRRLYSFNNGPYFVTAEHPFLTKCGWKSLNPEATAKENPNLNVGKLQLDDTLILANGKEVILQSIKEKVADPGTQLYNFILEGNNTYYANGYLVHNKDSPTDPQPSIPEFTCLKYKDGFVIARWRCASYASGYEFQFIYASEKIYYEDSNIKFQTLEISFGVNDSLPAGKYTGKLRSKHGTDKQSDWAVKTITKLPAPTVKTFEYNNTTVAFTITWESVQNSSGYIVEIVDTKYNIVASVDALATETSKTIPLSSFTGSGGTYIARVTAKAPVTANCEEGYINSNCAISEKTVEKLMVPTNISQSYDKQTNKLIVKWNNLASVSIVKYQLLLINVINQTQVGACTEVIIPEGSPATISKEIDTDSFLTNEAAEYKVKVQAMGNETTIDSDVGESPTTTISLGISNIIQTYHETDQRLEIRWEAVPDATGYRIQLVDTTDGYRIVDDKTIVAPYDSPGCDFLTEYFEKVMHNFYIAKVKALGSDQFIDSTFASMLLVKLPIPTVLTFGYSNTTKEFTISWESVQNSSGYIVEIVDTKYNIVASVDALATETSKTIPLSSFTGSGGTYKARVAAKGEDDFINSNYAISENTVEKLMVPTNVTQRYDNDKITVTWQDSATDVDYEVQFLLGDELVPLDPQPAIEYSGKTAIINAKVIGQGLTYHARVRTKTMINGDRTVGEWSTASNPITTRVSTVPTSVGMAYKNDKMTVTWDDCATDVDYEVQILVGKELLPLDPQPTADYSGKTAIIDDKALDEGLTYYARVRAVQEEYRNVLKNGDASQGLNDWNILKNGGDQWAVEDGPAASCPGKPVRYNFVTSYEWDAKAQTIDLIAEGFKPDFLDQGPRIHISEWMCSRPDSKGEYQLVVELRDENQKNIERFDTGVIYPPNDPGYVYPWKEIVHTFNNYQSGLRYIYFEHSGKDITWWKGHYGSKITGAQVRIQTMINGDRTVGEWSTASNSITARVSTVPTNVALAYNNDKMTVTWQDSAKDVDYEVQVLVGDGLVPLDPQPAVEYSGKTATIDDKALDEGLTYYARVRAVQEEYRNVLKNGDASQGLNDWNILKNGGDQWAVEDGPAASCPGKPVRYNFVTSYEWDAKAQTIDLIAEGFKPDFLDQGPRIHISEWMCSRPDSKGEYQLVVELRDENQKNIERFDTGVIYPPNDPGYVYPWKEIVHTFNNYQSGLRYIYFEHSGKDITWWKGHYGSKITGAQVRIQTMINSDRKVGEWSTASNQITTRAP